MFFHSQIMCECGAHTVCILLAMLHYYVAISSYYDCWMQFIRMNEIAPSMCVCASIMVWAIARIVNYFGGIQHMHNCTHDLANRFSFGMFFFVFVNSLSCFSLYGIDVVFFCLPHFPQIVRSSADIHTRHNNNYNNNNHKKNPMPHIDMEFVIKITANSSESSPKYRMN